MFLDSAYVLYKNPILFLLPSIGSTISIIAEVFFITGLYNNNTNNYFPFSDIFVLLLFFTAFVVTYFQLVIVRHVMLKRTPGIINYYYGESIVGIFLIYSIYAVALVDIGAYENDIRETFAIKSDPFSLYTYKLESYNDIIAIIPFGILLSLLSVIVSFFFNMWMVEYYMLIRNQIANRSCLYESLKNIIGITIRKDKRSKMVPILLVICITLVISMLGFVLANIAIIAVEESLSTYMFQFAISRVIGNFYSPFYLVFLFFILFPRSYM
jgi:hypothetical protein